MTPHYDLKTTHFSNSKCYDVVYLSNFLVEFEFPLLYKSILSENLISIEVKRHENLIKCKFSLNIISNELQLIKELENLNGKIGNIHVYLLSRDGSTYYKSKFFDCKLNYKDFKEIFDNLSYEESNPLLYIERTFKYESSKNNISDDI